MRAILHLPDQIVLSSEPGEGTQAPEVALKFAAADADALGHVVSWQIGKEGTTVELDLDPDALRAALGEDA